MPDRFERAGQAFAELCRVMATLRAPGGCPWDRAQTRESLKPYLIEEAYEVLDAMDAADPATHRDELGDLLLQIVFQAEISNEAGGFDVAAVAEAIRHKLLRRHPHVFGDVEAKDADAALASWEAMKAKERGPDGSALDGVPRHLPALLRALRCGEKAAAVGFDWPDVDGARQKVEEEWRELDAADSAQERQEEMGDLLFALVNVCRHLAIDPETALRSAVDKFQRRFGSIEKRLQGTSRAPRDLSLDELEQLWQDAKSDERSQTRV